MTEHRDKLERETQALSAALVQLRNENQSLEKQLSSLAADKEMAAKQRQETQLKLNTLTEYFEQKELQLHKSVNH